MTKPAQCTNTGGLLTNITLAEVTMAAEDYTKQCTKCGETKPTSEYGKRKASKDGLHVYCKQCRKKEHTEYYASNKEKILARGKLWRKANPEKALQYSREHQSRWRKSDPNGYREYMRKYRSPELNRKYSLDDYYRNRDERLAAAREWRSRNKETCYLIAREYRKNNPERIRALRWAYKARRRCADGSHTGDDISRIYALQRGICACCGNKLNGNYHVDHIMPLSRGGSNDPNNLQLLCARCNLRKGAKHPVDFMQENGLLI